MEEAFVFTCTERDSCHDCTSVLCELCTLILLNEIPVQGSPLILKKELGFVLMEKNTVIFFLQDNTLQFSCQKAPQVANLKFHSS